jgi:RecA-family ATPase
MLALKLAHVIGNPEPKTTDDSPAGITDAPRFFGQPVMARGTAVVITTEDDFEDLQKRLQTIDPTGMRFDARSQLIVLPLLSAGGARAILTNGVTGLQCTEFWFKLREQLSALPNLKLVVLDPLSSFVSADLNDNTVGSALMAMLGEVATETRATIMAIHHFAKATVPTSLKNARTAIKGAGALVDNTRWSLVLWEADEDDAGEVLKAIGQPERARQSGVVYFGGVAKGNAGQAKILHTLVRSPNGV